MSDSDVWSVDSVAANSLNARLGGGFSDEQVEAIARHFARHRRMACEWATERAYGTILQMLEKASLELLFDKSEEWGNGFQRAEQLVMELTPEDLLGIVPGSERTKGQFLRAMVRQARRQ